MKILALFYFLWILVCPKLIMGCTCDSIPPFADGIDKETSIIQIQILKHDLLPVTEIREYKLNQIKRNHNFKESAALPPPLPPFNYSSYTQVKVLDHILGKPIADTIVFFNGAGSMCLGSISKFEIDTKYILKVSESRKKEIEPELMENLQALGLWMKDWENKEIYSNGICHVWLLKLQDETVKG